METDNNNTSLNQISAQLYLDKLREFSENSLLRIEDDSEQALERSLSFISQILPIDCAIVAEVNEEGNKAAFKSVLGVELERGSFSNERAEIVSILTKEVNVFCGEDEGNREVASFLLNNYPVLSGISVPIVCETGPCGILAVYSKEDYQFTQSKVLFLKSMANVIALFLKSNALFQQIEVRDTQRVINAKREWESAVDSMTQLVIVLDGNSNIVRTNRAIEYWGIGTVESHIGTSVVEIVQKIKDDNASVNKQNWEEVWSNLKRFGRLEWEVLNPQQEKNYRFSLRLLKNQRPTEKKKHHGFAVLVVDDITQIKFTENQLQQHKHKLEDQVMWRTNQLEELNIMLRQKHAEYERSKSALQESEGRYAQLVQNSMTGICTLKSGRIDVYNDRFAEILGFNNSGLSNKLFLQLISGADRKKVMSALAELDNCLVPVELSVVRARDGHYKGLWLELKFDYLKTSSENTVLVYMHDITLQKNVELSLRESENRLQKLSCQIINTQENERRRLALDLHDGIGQSLSAIKYSLEDVIRSSQNSSDKDCFGILDGVVASIRETIDETRSMAMNLRPSVLDDLGVVSAINWFCGQFTETYKNIKIEKQLHIDELDIDNDRKIVIYRILQEALNNVAKHSGANRVRIFLEKTNAGNIYLQISDNGQGIDNNIKGLGYNSGMGLYGIQERAELSGGVFTLISIKAGGTVIDVKWVDKVSLLS